MRTAPLVAVLLALAGVVGPAVPAEASAGRATLQVGLEQPIVLRTDAAGEIAVLGATRPVVIGHVEELTPWDLGAAGERWLVAATRRTLDGRERLALLTGGGESRGEIRPPRGQVGARRTEPVLLAPERLLTGAAGGAIAWLEGGRGPRRLSVRAAAWTGEAFAAPVAISDRGRSQTGLAGAVLDDGRLLLVWSAFDGEDHELVWSLGDGTLWSAPARLAPDNRVPDVTPTVTAVPGGAFAAWSQYDGNDYRLAVARFDGDVWQPPRLVGAAGVVDPELVRGAGEPVLSALRVAPRAWLAFRFAPIGGSDPLEGFQLEATADAARPLVQATESGVLQLIVVDGEGR